MEREIITLKNGLKVANFSSPHPFSFESGEVIPRVPEERSKGLLLNALETDVKGNHRYMPIDHPRNMMRTIKLQFRLTSNVEAEINYWGEVFYNEDVDVVLVPLPVMTALRESIKQQILDDEKTTVHLNTIEDVIDNALLCNPFRVIRVKDRETKLIYNDLYCI